jgi:hypothetical protein
MRHIGKTILLLVLLSQFNLSNGQVPKSNIDFEIVFGGYFYNDTVRVVLNDIAVAENLKIRSGSNGATNLRIMQTKENLIIRHSQVTKKMKRISSGNKLVLQIWLNGVNYKYQFDMEKGKILHVQYHTPEESTRKIFIVEQSDEYPIFL